MSAADAIREGEAAEESGDLLQAIAAYESAVDDADQLVVADAHFHLGRVAWRQGRFDAAIASFERARAIAVQLDAHDVRARVENGIGAVHHRCGAYAQARAAYDVALQYTTDPAMRAKVLLNLGVIANTEGDFESARSHYLRSRATFQQADDRTGEALALHNLGMLYAHLEQWDEADEAYRMCLELCEAQGDRQMMASVLLNCAALSSARGRFEEAVASCDLAIAICAQTGDEIQRGEALRWMGHALRGMASHEHAERALREAIRIARRSRVKPLEAEAARELAASLTARRELAAARRWLGRALAIFETLGTQRDVADVRAALLGLAAPGGGRTREG